MFFPREKRIWHYSIFYLIILSLFFFLSYGFANYVTSIRHDVGVVVFSWERLIPLWPWTIIPYWSIDLFYGLAILLAPTKCELHILVKRLISAQLLCVTAFLIWPLTFSFQRPPLEGYFGILFDLLMGFDMPFNQAPSLHITLLLILWVFYAKHMRGILLYFLNIWFTLIAISVLTTWQHHFLDVPLGALAGAMCIWMWPEKGASIFCAPKFPAQIRWGVIYCCCLFLCLFFIYCFGLCAIWLIWPASAFFIVALNYLFVGAGGFQKKQNGKFDIVIGFLLLPYQIIMKINAYLWTIKTDQMTLILPNLYIGKIPSKKVLASRRFATVIDLCAELPIPITNEKYVLIPTLDMTTPSIEQCKKAVKAINENITNGDLLICCALGYSRSATILIAWLLFSKRAKEIHEAILLVKKLRPNIVINSQQMLLLAQWKNLLDSKNALSISNYN